MAFGKNDGSLLTRQEDQIRALIFLSQGMLNEVAESTFGSSALNILTGIREGEDHCWRMPHAGPPWHHGRRQHPEAMCFAGSLPSEPAEYAW